MTIFSISNHKGGTGKTTSTLNIGAAMALKKFKVLLVDLDAQSNLSQSLGYKNKNKTLYDALSGTGKVEPVAISQYIDLIPSCLSLADVELIMAGKMAREVILKNILAPFKSKYDYILIDCPPSLGLLTLNAFVASDKVLIPLQAQYLALQGLNGLISVLDQARTLFNPTLTIGGVFITQYSSRRVLNRSVANRLPKIFAGKVFETYIRESVSLSEAPSKSKNIFEYKPSSNAALDYQNLVKEILKGEGAAA